MEKMLQLENYSRLNFGILAHSPGADKNLFILDYLQHFASCDVFEQDTQEICPHTTCLIVPKSAIYQWHNVAKEYKQLKMVGLATLGDLRTFKESPHKYDLVIISFEIVHQFAVWSNLFGHSWRRIIFDTIESLFCAPEMTLPVAQFFWYCSFGSRETLATFIQVMSKRNPIAKILQLWPAKTIDMVYLTRDIVVPNVTVQEHYSNKISGLDSAFFNFTIMSKMRAETFVSLMGIPIIDETRLCRTRADSFLTDGCNICMATNAKFVCKTSCCQNLLCFECCLRIDQTSKSCPFCRGKRLTASARFVQHFPRKWIDIASLPQILAAVGPGRRTLVIFSLGESIAHVEMAPNVVMFSGNAKERWEQIVQFNDPDHTYQVILAGFVRDLMGIAFATISDLVLIGTFTDYKRFIGDTNAVKVHIFV